MRVYIIGKEEEKEEKGGGGRPPFFPPPSKRTNERTKERSIMAARTQKLFIPTPVYSPSPSRAPVPVILLRTRENVETINLLSLRFQKDHP